MTATERRQYRSAAQYLRSVLVAVGWTDSRIAHTTEDEIARFLENRPRLAGTHVDQVARMPEVLTRLRYDARVRVHLTDTGGAPENDKWYHGRDGE